MATAVVEEPFVPVKVEKNRSVMDLWGGEPAKKKVKVEEFVVDVDDEEVGAAAIEGTVDGSWSCSTCTFHNTPLALQCGMCLARKPLPSPSDVTSSAPPRTPPASGNSALFRTSVAPRSAGKGGKGTKGIERFFSCRK